MPISTTASLRRRPDSKKVGKHAFDLAGFPVSTGYAAQYPEKRATKEEIYENLTAGRLSALGQAPKDRSSRTPPARRKAWPRTPCKGNAGLCGASKPGVIRPASGPHPGRPGASRGAFHVTDMSREQMEAAAHHEPEDGKEPRQRRLIPSGDATEHTAPEKPTVWRWAWGEVFSGEGASEKAPGA